MVGKGVGGGGGGGGTRGGGGGGGGGGAKRPGFEGGSLPQYPNKHDSFKLRTSFKII